MADNTSLDDVLKQLYFDSEFGDKYIDTYDLIACAENLSGHSFEDFFNKYVFGTERLEYDIFEEAVYFQNELYEN